MQKTGGGKGIVGRSRGVTSFSLKVVAIIGMTCNHASWIFADQLPFPFYCVLMGAGGLTFPVMAFLISEGWRHTSDCNRYLLRLGMFAVISQVPFWVFLSHNLNVMFTLFIGLAVLRLHDTMPSKTAWLGIACIGTLASGLCDWGFIGVPMIVIAGLMPTVKKRALYSSALPMAAFGIPALLGILAGSLDNLPVLLYALCNGAAGLLLTFYNGERGRPLKWFFYLYYPAHIAVFGIAHGLLTGIWITA